MIFPFFDLPKRLLSIAVFHPSHDEVKAVSVA